MAELEPNTVERIRQRIGLPRSTTKDLLGVDKDTVFTTEDRRMNPVVVRRAVALDAAFEQWRAAVRYALEREAEVAPAMVDEDGMRYLTTRQAAYCLGIGDYHMSTLRNRGKIDAVLSGRGQGQVNLFAVQALYDLIDNGPRGYQAPLTHAFVEYVKRTRAEVPSPEPTEDREQVSVA